MKTSRMNRFLDGESSHKETADNAGEAAKRTSALEPWHYSYPGRVSDGQASARESSPDERRAKLGTESPLSEAGDTDPLGDAKREVPALHEDMKERSEPPASSSARYRIDSLKNGVLGAAAILLSEIGTVAASGGDGRREGGEGLIHWSWYGEPDMVNRVGLGVTTLMVIGCTAYGVIQCRREQKAREQKAREQKARDEQKQEVEQKRKRAQDLVGDYTVLPANRRSEFFSNLSVKDRALLMEERPQPELWKDQFKEIPLDEQYKTLLYLTPDLRVTVLSNLNRMEILDKLDPKELPEFVKLLESDEKWKKTCADCCSRDQLKKIIEMYGELSMLNSQEKFFDMIGEWTKKEVLMGYEHIETGKRLLKMLRDACDREKLVSYWASSRR
jgi:hypothetical protein